MRLPVVQPERPYILVPPVHRLNLFLPPQLLRHLGRSHAQRQQNKKDRNNQPHEHKALLTRASVFAILSHSNLLIAPATAASADYYSPDPPPEWSSPRSTQPYTFA